MVVGFSMTAPVVQIDDGEHGAAADHPRRCGGRLRAGPDALKSWRL